MPYVERLGHRVSSERAAKVHVEGPRQPVDAFRPRIGVDGDGSTPGRLVRDRDDHGRARKSHPCVETVCTPAASALSARDLPNLLLASLSFNPDI